MKMKRDKYIQKQNEIQKKLDSIDESLIINYKKCIESKVNDIRTGYFSEEYYGSRLSKYREILS